MLKNIDFINALSTFKSIAMICMQNESISIFEEDVQKSKVQEIFYKIKSF